MQPQQHQPHDEENENEIPHSYVATTPTLTKRARGMLAAFLLSIIAAIVSLLLAMNAWHYARHGGEHKFNQLAAELDDYKQATNKKIHDELTQQQKLLSEIQQQQQQQTSSIELQQRALKKLKHNIYSADDDWRLAEVRYLVQMAHYNIQLGRQTIAIALLQQAEQTLLEANNAEFSALQQAIANDLAAISSVATVDRRAILLKLTALSQQVAELPVTIPQTPPVTSDSSQTASTNWKSNLRQSLSAFEKLVIIRRHDQPIEPILASDQQLLLTQNLQLLLHEAAWAVLNGDDVIYHESINQVSSLLEHYYAKTDAKTEYFVKSLQSLNALEVSLQLPDVTNSLQQLKTIAPTTPKMKSPQPTNGQST